MALTFKDRVLETSVSVGTGDFICGGAQTGYQPFSTVGDGATVTYTIQGKNLDGTLTGDWEVGVGTYHLTGNYISRDTVLESSNSNAKVFFPAGDKDIFLDLPGERIVQSPTIAVSGNFVSYDGVTGQVIKDSGSKASDFATAAQGAKADTAVQQSVVGQPNGVASLDNTGKVPVSQIPQLGDLNYQGAWNASTNTPTLTSSVGTKGYYYVVSVAGTTNLNGITDWQPGDWAVFNGTIWQKIDNTDAVTSVNGYTGAVVLTQPDIAGTVPTSRTISTGTGLTGGGDLSANRTISFSTPAVGTWAATPSSANLAAAMTDETGSGSLVFGTNPTLANPNIDVVDFDTTYATTLTAGQLGWDGNNTLGLGMAGGNVVQHIGEDSFFYCKASSAITKGQVVMFTGAVGASAVVTGAPATGVTDGTYIMGIAAENIALNGFGLVQCFGTLRNVNTTGYADGDILWYNPTVTGGLTKTAPTAPNVKVQMAAVLNGGSAGGGSILIRVNPGSALGGTDSNVQITTPSNGQILSYDGGNSYWKNTSLTAGTGISVSSSANGVLTITNTSPSSGGTVTSITAGTGLSGGTITSSGTIALANTAVTAGSYTYASFTVDAQGRLTAASSGTAPVTSVSGTGVISSTGGTTPTISISQATTSTSGYLSSTDWNTFNNKQPAGAYLTTITVNTPLSGSGTAGSPIVISQANGTTNGYLSSTDWTTFNGKQVAYTNLTTIGSLANGTGWLYNNGSGTFSYSTPTKTDVGLGNVTNDTQTKAAVVPNTAPTSGQILVGNAGGTAYAPVSMSGDATLSSTGAATLATVNSNVGSFTNASVTVNAKGLVTAVSNGTAPVTTFSAGTTGFTPSTATSGAVTLAGTLNVANGGTGVTASTGANSVVLRDASQTINVANTFGFKNRIINGAMMIDQRNAGASVNMASGDGGYCLDRWRTQKSGSGVLALQQTSTAPAGFASSLKVTVSTSSTPAAGDFYTIGQIIEGYNFADMAWGTSSNQPITISFWVQSSITGTYTASVYNWGTGSYTYPSTFTINSANTWEQKTITISGATSAASGTWATGNTGSLYLRIDLGSGSNYSTSTANAWNSTGGFRVNGSVNLVSNASATFYITGVQLEKGSTATSFDYRPYTTELVLCQRYYQTYQKPEGRGVMNGTANLGRVGLPLQVQMRAAPTMNISGTIDWFDGVGVGTVTALNATYTTINSIEFDAIAATGTTVVGRPSVLYNGSNTGSLTASAEL